MTEKLDLFESGKNIVNEKFKGLFYGYFLTSLIAFNWDSLYFLAFSGKDAELKIKIVKYSFSLFHQLIAPALIGFALAIVSPYITSVIKKSHSLANRWMKSIDLDDENYVADHQADRNLARNKKIEQASMILEKINALENEFKNKKTQYKQTMDTDKNLREEHLKLSEEISKLNIEMQRKKTKLSELVATEENIEKQNKTIMDMSMKIGMLEPSALQSELTIKNLIQSQKEMDKKIAEIQEIINNRELEKDEMRVSVSEIIHDINMIIRIYI